MRRPWTRKCKECALWDECTWTECVEAMEDAAMNHSGEYSWRFLEHQFSLLCEDFEEDD